MTVVVKNLPANADVRDVGLILGWEDPLEEDMTTHSSILAWRIPWTEERGGLQCMGSQRVGHAHTICCKGIFKQDLFVPFCVGIQGFLRYMYYQGSQDHKCERMSKLWGA